jgi:hypothetical protein
MTSQDDQSYGELKAGITHSDLLEVINTSGYLFQAEVADKIRQQFSNVPGARIQEEWGYIDADSQGTRTLDVYAEVPLWESADGESDTRRAKIHPYLNILVECKQSELPYVLFLRAGTVSEILNFPEFGGIKSNDIRVFPEEWQEDSGTRGESFAMSLHDSFACHNLEAFEGPPFNAISLAKVMRKGGGGKLEISGEETYRGLTLPLLKAADYVKSQVAPSDDAKALSPRLIVTAAVVKAPLMGVFLHSGETFLAGVPLARVCRVEPANGEWGTSGNTRFFDIVHSSHWEEYLRTLMDDSLELARRMLGHEEELLSGAALQLKDEPTEDDREPDPYVSFRALPEEYSTFLDRPSHFRIAKTRSDVTIDFIPSEADEFKDASNSDFRPDSEDSA